MTYGIYLDYDNEAVIRPYAIVAKHPSEEHQSGTMYDRYLYKFAEYKVHENCGVTWGEYLMMDMESANMTLNTAKRYVEMQRKHYTETQSALEGEKKALADTMKDKK